MLYKFKAVKPQESSWLECEGKNKADAVQNWHLDNCGLVDTGFMATLEDGRKEMQYFALFEFEDGEQLISRICKMGLYRKGGVPPPGRAPTLQDIADRLEVDVDELQGWIGEEEYAACVSGEPNARP